MKKYLSWIVLALTLAVLIAAVACTGDADQGGETEAPTTPTTDVQGDVTDEGTRSDTDESTPSDAESDTDGNSDTESESASESETKTETEPAPIVPTVGVRFDDDKIIRHLSAKNQTEASLVEDAEEGKVLQFLTTGTAVNDPYVQINYAQYAKVIKAGNVNLSEYPYILFRIKNDGCTNANFKIYWSSSTITGPTEQAAVTTIFDNASDGWQYVWIDMSKAANWSGNLISLRLDYMDGNATAGERMLLAGVFFAKSYDEVKGIIGAAGNPFEIETDPEKEAEIDDLLSREDSAPAVNNEKQTAAAEDADLDLWFNHSYTKTPAEEVTSTGWYTYMMRMAKNEGESCHLLLASKGGHEGLTVTLSHFANADGVELRTELLYGYYFDDVDGKTIADPTPWVKEDQTFAIADGRSQMFIIKAVTDMDTPAGLYEATVTVTDAEGNEIKRAAVSVYVWNFVLPEETSCKTQMDLSWYNIYMAHKCYEGDDGLLYKNYYDLLLDNRICAYTLPYSEEGTFSDSRILEYLDNPRVTAFNPLGWKVEATESNVTAAYNFLSQKQEWLDKAYFYLVDEPMTKDHLDEINSLGEMLARCFPGYKMMAPEHVNYSWNAESTVDNLSYVKDSVNVWCFKPYFFTTYAEYNYDRRLTYVMTPLLEKNLGTFADRMEAERAEGDELWWYVTRRPEEPEITLAMESEAVKYRILFWQQKLYGVDNFLYYLANDWYFVGEDRGVNSKHEVQDNQYDIYGNGVLLYCGADFDEYGPVGSLRLEGVRDGIEDFEYLTMLTELYGAEKTELIIRRLTTSLSNYNTDTENFTDLRVAIGNLIEETLVE